MLVRLQFGKDCIAHSVHVRPTSYSTAGLQSTDLLGQLRFRGSDCTYVDGNECYVMAVNPSFDLDAFAATLPKTNAAYTRAARHLDECGIVLDHFEGGGFFSGRASERSRRSRLPSAGHGDGHAAQEQRRMKEAEDDSFRYVCSWISGGSDKGWTTHYWLKHSPLAAEVADVFAFLGLEIRRECPEFDFEPCHWRFTPYAQSGSLITDGNADIAHRWFDHHKVHFSPGIEQLLHAQSLVRPFGLFLYRESSPTPTIPVPASPTRGRTAPSPSVDALLTSPTSPVPTLVPSLKYEVAISFAGPQRPLAERLATRLRDAEIQVFYDAFYPEHLWGKDLAVEFDNIYRKQARYCVMFLSQEYVERMWTIRERGSALARAVAEKGREYILPVKVEEVDVPVLPPTTGYLSIDNHDPETIAEILIHKLRAS